MNHFFHICFYLWTVHFSLGDVLALAVLVSCLVDNEVPCDLVLLGTSDPQGVCYVVEVHFPSCLY